MGQVVNAEGGIHTSAASHARVLNTSASPGCGFQTVTVEEPSRISWGQASSRAPSLASSSSKKCAASRKEQGEEGRRVATEGSTGKQTGGDKKRSA
jgi:hypothetical protein